MKNIIISIFLLFSVLSFSQSEIKDYNRFQTDVLFGRPIEHDTKLKDAIDGNSYGILLSFNSPGVKNNKFNNLYNFPEKGFSILYQNFNSDVLGEVYGGYRHFNYKLTKNPKNNLSLVTAFGLGYATKSYHETSNNKNHAIGSKLLASAYVKLQFFQLLLKEKLRLNTGLSLIHFSNVALKNPNLGINTVSLNLGFNYLLAPVVRDVPKKEIEDSKIDKNLYFSLILRGGYNESVIIDSGLFPFYTVTFYGSKPINNYSTFTFGADYFKSDFLKTYLRHINSEEHKNYNENDDSRVGVFVGHELIQNNFSFISQIGFNIYYPAPYISRVYERFGLKYKLSKHWFSEITLKINLFRAEALEIGLGYRF